jgi:hypothetical protein
MLRARKESSAAIISQNIFNFPIFDSIVECAPIESKCISNQKRVSERARLYTYKNMNPSIYIFEILLFALRALSNHSETSRVGGGRTDAGRTWWKYARARFLLADHQKWENRDARFDCAKESGLLQNWSAGQAARNQIYSNCDMRLLFILHTFRICNAGNCSQFAANDNRLSHPASHTRSDEKSFHAWPPPHQFWASLLTNDYGATKSREMKWKFISRAI